MTQPAPEIEALAEALAEVRGGIAEFRRERDARESSVGAYGGYLRVAAEIAARLSKQGWRLVATVDKLPE